MSKSHSAKLTNRPDVSDDPLVSRKCMKDRENVGQVLYFVKALERRLGRNELLVAFDSLYLVKSHFR